jgi:hypothetical protein
VEAGSKLASCFCWFLFDPEGEGDMLQLNYRWYNLEDCTHLNFYFIFEVITVKYDVE